MKSWKPLLLIFGVGATLAHGQTMTFTDKSGNMTLSNFSSWSTRVTGENKFHFKATGEKLEGAWVSQGLTITAKTIEGDAERRSGGKLVLKNATLTGGVHAVSKKGSTVFTLDCASTVIKEDSAELTRFDCDGGVTIDTVTHSTGQKIPTTTHSHTTGHKGTVFVKQGAGIQSATLFGPVRIETERYGVGVSKANLIASCQRMDMVQGASGGSITLIGDVVITGSDPVVAGEIHVDKAVIYLDANGTATGMDSEASPGVMRFTDRRKGARN